MSGNEVKTATANAIRIWMRESEGVGYSYMTTSNIRAKSGYNHVYNAMVDLVNKARSAGSSPLSWSGQYVTTSPSVIELAPNAGGSALTATFTVNNPASDLAINTSKLPSGVTISGSGSTRTITAPHGTSDTTISNVFEGQSNRSIYNIYFYKPSYGSAYQPLIVWDYGTERTVIYGDLTIKGQSGGYIQVIKRDDVTSAYLQGAVFGVYSNDGTKVDTLVTNVNGTEKSKFLPSGNYYLQEITPPAGYVHDDTKHDVNVAINSQTHVVWLKNTKIKGRVKLLKVGEADNSLEGAVFGIYSSNGTFIEDLTTDDTGNATSSLIKYGRYYLQEKIPPPMYNLNTEKLDFEIRNSNEIVEVKAINISFKGRVRVTKTGESNDTLQSAKFGIYDSSDDFIEEITSFTNGVATSSMLHFGDYYIKETQAPVGYNLNTDKHNFTITSSNQIIQIGVANTKIRGRAELIKQDKLDGSYLDGAVFGIYDSSDNLIEQLTTDANGKAISSLLEYGDYYFKEITAPAKYVLDGTKHNFSISENNKTLSLNILNDPIRGRVRIIKVGEVDNPLEGIVFSVYDTGDTLIEELTTDADGKATSSLMRYGDYYVQETSTLENYILDDTKHSIEIRNHQEVISLDIENALIRGKVQILKTGEINDPLQGVVFEIYDASDALIEELTTDGNGIGLSSDLIYGNYYLKEISTLPQYNMLTDTIPFEIRTNNATVKLDVANTLKRGGFKIVKAGEENEPLEGVVFKLHDSNDSLVETLTTDENGMITSTALIYGDYFLKEISAPKEFSIPSDSIKVEIRDNGTTIDLDIKNILVRGSIKIVKTNLQDSKPIEGVVFSLFNEAGEEIAELTTDENGIATTDTLFYGTYHIQEKSVPQGFVLDNKLHKLDIHTDGVIEKQIQNQPIVGSLEVYFRHVDHKHELARAFAYTDWVGEPYMNFVDNYELDGQEIEGYSYVKSDYPAEEELIDGKLRITYWYDEEISGTWNDVVIPKTGIRYPIGSYLSGLVFAFLSALVVGVYLMLKKD
jgi:uncharacterized surface anchored protein